MSLVLGMIITLCYKSNIRGKGEFPEKCNVRYYKITKNKTNILFSNKSETRSTIFANYLKKPEKYVIIPFFVILRKFKHFLSFFVSADNSTILSEGCQF